MGWLCGACVLVVFQFISTSFGLPHNLPTQEQLLKQILPPELEDSTQDMQDNVDEKLRNLGSFLAYILTNSWPKTGVPILYVEDYNRSPEIEIGSEDENTDSDDDNIFEDLQEQDNFVHRQPVPLKRARYYRKYPWKRQNTREAFETDNRYLCQPSKDDIFRLLVALHESRNGDRGRAISFCNRKRPAAAIFTNIRFLGKRK